jgi:HSP20 family protein
MEVKMTIYTNTSKLFEEVFNMIEDTATALITDCNIVDLEDSYEISVLLPAVKKEDISVDYDGSVITISAERFLPEKKYLVQSFKPKKFKTNVAIKNIDFEQTVAALADGVLTLSIPKSVKTFKLNIN